MNSSTTQDVSLYELVLGSEEVPTPLQISPATLKSIVGSAIDILIEHKQPTTLWIKLPRDEAWQSEIRRYCEEATETPHTIYLFHNYREEAGNGNSPSNNLERSPQNPALRSTDQESALTTFQLHPDSPLKREYFLLFASPELYGLVLAHRPRSGRPGRADSNTSATHKAITDDEGLEKKQPLLAFCSFNQTTLQQVFRGIQQAAQMATMDLPADSSTAAPLTAELLSQWQALLQNHLERTADPVLLSRLFMTQVQRQEEVWHRSTTYRKQAEAVEGLQVQNEELLNALRLKDEFLSTVGQELRTPLTNMKTALTLLNSPSLKPAQRQRYMQVLSTECDRQGSLIASLLDLVQLDREIETATMQAVHLAEIVPGVVSTYQPVAQEKGIMLAYTIPENLPAVTCLSAWVKQIVINLLHNGIKFTPQSGQVWVRAKQQGDYVQIEVRDTGIGIPASEIPKIFERFYRARHVAGEDPGGAGLGLTIVQQILLRCGGSISVKSKLSEGSTFNVLLPIYKSTPESAIS